jgi:hypothetical protein
MTVGGVVGWHAKRKKLAANAEKRRNFMPTIINQSLAADFCSKIMLRKDKLIRKIGTHSIWPVDGLISILNISARVSS